MGGLTFFDPNQIHLDQRSSELLCIRDRLLLGQAKKPKSIQGHSSFLLAWQVVGAWLTSHGL
jgi:hypothetical protein